MDIKKLKYDLAMQCALVDVLKEQQKQTKNSSYDIRISMLENFQSYYIYFNALHDSNFEEFIDLE